nr:hypothetical protein [Tanacetum cinerariifolium]
NSSTRTHQAATRHRGKAVVNSPQPIYAQEPSMVDDDEDTSKDKEIDKLMALISLSNLEFNDTTARNMDMLLGNEEAGIQLNAEQVDWKDDTDDESDDQE